MVKKKLFKGAIYGGIIVFAWCLFSWMVLPWHTKAFKKFQDEESVAEAIKNNASESGVYILPNAYKYDSNTPSDQLDKGMMLMQNGPTLFASIQVNGMGQKTVKPFLVSLIIQILGAGIVSWMLLQTKGLKTKQRVRFVTLYGLAIGILGVLPAWNWWSLSLGYVSCIFFDLVIGWFLAGLAIAKVCKP
ncbi:MAG: hypothetical protein ABUT20_63685 [Bacteroidota bacterium]